MWQIVPKLSNLDTQRIFISSHGFYGSRIWKPFGQVPEALLSSQNRLEVGYRHSRAYLSLEDLFLMCVIRTVGEWVPLECLHNMAAGFPWDQGGSCNVFYDLVSDVTHAHFHNILLHTQMNPGLREGPTHGAISERWASPWRRPQFPLLEMN